MADEPNDAVDGGPIGAAARRLERAVVLLGGRIKTLSTRAEGAAGGLFDEDRSQLASELDAARAREKALETAGAEASLAIGEAIEGIRRALDRAEEG
jgi:hypothetical protein